MLQIMWLLIMHFYPSSYYFTFFRAKSSPVCVSYKPNLVEIRCVILDIGHI